MWSACVGVYQLLNANIEFQDSSCMTVQSSGRSHFTRRTPLDCERDELLVTLHKTQRWHYEPQLDGGEWSASRSGHFNPGEEALRLPWNRRRVGPRAVLDVLEKRKICCLCWWSTTTTRSRSRQPVHSAKCRACECKKQEVHVVTTRLLMV